MWMNAPGLEKPIFFVGMPRSGTTILFEAFARHPELGWPSNYSERQPHQPWLNLLCRLLDNRIVHLRGHKQQYAKARFGNRYLPHPDEAYCFWDHYTGREFSREYLTDTVVDTQTRERVRSAVEAILRWQGRRRFAAKLTGPPRIAFLDSIFPDAQFVHVVRDGRAVVHSLLKVGFWRRKGGFDGPFWCGGISESELLAWHASGRDPGVLAALQWQHIVSTARSESRELPQDRYREIKYEEFIDSPHHVLSNLYNYCTLSDADAGHDFLDHGGVGLKNMNTKFHNEVAEDSARQIAAALQPMLAELGYV
ncbi:hypothetical protein MNBD_GAMMA24-925 [hydrothermal vent metagenome]|uniref:Sulfotransferase n=1 Tax=hydrothermal vent metagenome TaxID=652676 RepID=A0A3B1BP69_9ZZZZ